MSGKLLAAAGEQPARHHGISAQHAKSNSNTAAASLLPKKLCKCPITGNIPGEGNSGKHSST